ncbi:hypothetical protein TNCV_3692791 [Trichonephila clavipes]|nr:hypothetical protein TNCV_3692791 [Trichonephila clavipes]
MVRRWCRQFSEGRQSVHDEDGSHTARRTAAVLTEFGWELFDQLPIALILLPAIFTFSCPSRSSCPPTDHLIGTSAHAPQRLVVTYGHSRPWPSKAFAPLSLSICILPVV